jgi:predicted nuclease of predicted toxin-antitoxin system
LNDLFPDSSHVQLLGLASASDRALWEFAKSNDFVVVSLDADFAEMSALLGGPPKVIWLRCGNQSTTVIEALMRDHSDTIGIFGLDTAAACIEIY